MPEDKSEPWNGEAYERFLRPLVTRLDVATDFHLSPTGHGVRQINISAVFRKGIPVHAALVARFPPLLEGWQRTSLVVSMDGQCGRVEIIDMECGANVLGVPGDLTSL